MLFISFISLSRKLSKILFLAGSFISQMKAVEPLRIGGIRPLVLRAGRTSFGHMVLRGTCACLVFLSCGAHALQTGDRPCPDGQAITTFLESVGQAGDMETVRHGFTKMLGPQVASPSPATTVAACWTLKTTAGFDHPLRAIVLSLNDEMLEGEKNQLKPKVKEKYCLAGSVVARNFKRIEAASEPMDPVLRKSTFSFPSSTFTRLMVHELNGCLIHIEFVAFQPQQ